MNYEYRKKPVVIEAFQMTRAQRVSSEHWPQWMHEAWNKKRKTIGSLYPEAPYSPTGRLEIGTLEGAHLVSWNDWIIKEVEGDLYLCKPDIFEATYEAVE